MFVVTFVKLQKALAKMDEEYKNYNWKECYEAAKNADELLDKYAEELGGFASAEGYFNYKDRMS